MVYCHNLYDYLLLYIFVTSFTMIVIMKILNISRLLMTLFILLFVSSFIFSQDQIDLNKTNGLSDDEIESLMLLGLDEEQLKLLGLNIGQPEKDNQLNLPPETLIDDENEIISDKFGYDFFSKIPTTVNSASDLPIPTDYRIQVGNKLTINLTGSKDITYNLQVMLDGTILIPEIGKFFVVGERLDSARKNLNELVSQFYVGVSANLTINELSAKKISVVGAVTNPGTYLVNPFTTITSAVAYAGRVEEYGSLRNIALVKSDGKRYEFDLYDLLINGDRSNDRIVEAGDTIVITGTDNFVEVLGSVIRPSIYEYKEDDKFQNLIDFALGFNTSAQKNNIFALRMNENDIYSEQIELDDMVNENPIIELYVGSKSLKNDRDIFVSGNGVSDGYFKIKGNLLKDLLEQLNFTNDIYPFYAIYEYETNLGFEKNKTSISLADPSTYLKLETYKNARLYFYDREQILELSDKASEKYKGKLDELIMKDTSNDKDENKLLADDKTIKTDYIQLNIAGDILFIPVAGKLTAKQLHSYFGVEDNISYKNTSAITVSNSMSDAYLTILNSSDLVAISIPKIKQNLIEVEISGEVLSPGKYLISASSTLDELYILSGGLLESSFKDGVIVSRVDTKENQKKALKEARTILIDSLIQKSATLGGEGMKDINAMISLADSYEPTGRISGDFSPESDTAKGFILKDGDSIIIPAQPNAITVQGEVLNSTSFVFNPEMNLADYIATAGGYTSYADKSATFVIRANGEAVTINKNIFAGESVKMMKGDTIVVPRDLDQLEGLPLIQAATSIISDIAFSAASLNAINN